MKINVHAGHALDGNIACGAVGLIKESTEARKVKNLVIKYLKANGHTVYDCTVDNGYNQGDILAKIVSKCNTHAVDLDISIHFNAGGGSGTEVLVYNEGNTAYKYAEKIVSNISKLGFKNRGVKVNSSLYVLRRTKSPSLLIECCFVDSKDDCKIYDSDKIARAIVKALGVTASLTKPVSSDIKVKIKSDTLNIRAGAGTKYKVLGMVKKGEVYTIIKTSGTWGKLKSGAGWINISNKYVIKV